MSPEAQRKRPHSDLADILARDPDTAMRALKTLAESPTIQPSRRVAARRLLKDMAEKPSGRDVRRSCQG